MVLLFLELPFGEVDVNVHPSKTEVRFRQQSLIHDFVRDSVRAGLVKARPVPQFTREITAHATSMAALTPEMPAGGANGPASLGITATDAEFALHPPTLPAANAAFSFNDPPIPIEGNAALPVARFPQTGFSAPVENVILPSVPAGVGAPETPSHEELASLRALGQVQNSFIVAVGENSLWIVDQHVAHERVLFEKVLRERATNRIESQRLLMPLIIELTPAQQAVYAEIDVELGRNGFEIEPFGSRTLAVKTAPAGIEASLLERMFTNCWINWSASARRSTWSGCVTTLPLRLPAMPPSRSIHRWSRIRWTGCSRHWPKPSAR